MKIYIDQGYNPQNQRNDTCGFHEPEIISQIATQLSSILQTNGFETLLSSPTPETRPNRGTSSAARVNEANEWEADYFISLGTNAAVDPFATGSQAIIYRMTSPAKPLAESILERLHLSTNLQNRGVTAQPDLYILRKTIMPAVLVRMGFITNEGDVTMMAEHPEQFAQGIANGVIAYLGAATLSDYKNNTAPTAYFQLYPESRTGSCYLTVSVYSRNKIHKPISKADITVYQGNGGKHIVVYRGQTDMSGRTMPIELPLYQIEDKYYENIQPIMYCICVRHPDYLPKNQWMDVKDEKVIRTEIDMEEKRIREM